MNWLHRLGMLAGLRKLTNSFRRARRARQKPVRRNGFKTRISTTEDIKPGDRVRIGNKTYRVRSCRTIVEKDGVTKKVNLE